MGSIEERIASLGYTLPDAAAPVANYVSTVSVDGAGLVFTSGHVPRNEDGSFVTGRLGDDLAIEDGYEAAKNVGLALLASLKVELGDLDRVDRVVKVLCMVNCTSDFADQPAVANGASDLMVEVFGDKGRHGPWGHSSGVVGTAQWSHRNLRRDVHSTLQGLRIDSGDLAGDADGVRSATRPRARR